MGKDGPKISVIVPVHNCRETIEQCLNSLVRIDHPSFEIVVVDDGSTDETPEICRTFPQVKLVEVPKGGPSKARNIGMAFARGNLVAFTDGDCIVERDWLTELEKGFTGPEIAGVGGNQLCPDDDSHMGSIIHAFLKTIGFVADYVKTDTRAKETEHNPTCNVMYRRRVLEDVGGFNEELWPGEDVELDLHIRRRGYRLIYNPAACVAHYRPGTYHGFARMLYRYGRAQGYLVRKYGPFRRIHYVPIAVLTGSALLIGLTWGNPAVLAVLACAWPCLVLAFRLKTRSLSRAVQFTHLMLITLSSWNAGFVAGFVTRRAGMLSC